jgi:uncharacterized protein YdeI (YjbR/CyaY-like superfamily)
VNKSENSAAAAKPAVDVPHELATELKKNKTAQTAWNALPASHQREHAKYVAEAKQLETRQRRAINTVQRLSGTTR